jgi:2-oxoacid:acceptor oxidoreductase gamma subunit (pyruvate/2-ketoisovalerate family)
MKKKIHETIICAGFGGQGIMLIGKILADVGMREGYNVSWFPSYGAEVRGGTANSSVHISSETISSPMVSEPTICIAMNKLSLNKFISKVKKGGLIIVNTSLTEDIPKREDIQIAEIPLTKLATELGNVKAANMIALGALIGIKKILPLDSVLHDIENVFFNNKELIAINQDAIGLGYRLVSGENNE